MSTESTIYTEYPDSFACLTVSSAPSFAEKPPIWMSHLAPLSAFAAGLAGAGVVTFFLGGSSLLVFTVCTGFFTWLLAQVPLVDLPLAQIAKNAGLMFFGFFPRTAAAALVLALYWGATLLYLPATILTILAFGFWLPVTIALMIVYPGLEKVFKLEETINARRAAEIEERMAQNQPKFDQ